MGMLQLLQIVPPPSEGARFCDRKPGEVFRLITFADLKAGECYVPTVGPCIFIKMTAGTAFNLVNAECHRVSEGLQVRRIDATLHWRIAQ